MIATGNHTHMDSLRYALNDKALGAIYNLSFLHSKERLK